MYNSHSKARELFDATSKSYHLRSKGKVSSFSSLIFLRRNKIVNKFIKSISSKNGEALDFGMGPAVFCKACIERGFSYLGIDISSKMVDEAKAKKIKNAIFEVGDIDILHKYANSMDLVLAIGLIDYLEHPKEGINILAKCVTKDGYLILSFRNRYSLPTYLRDFTRKVRNFFNNTHGGGLKKAFFSDVNEHSFDYSLHLKPTLKMLGFQNIEVEYFNCSPFFFDFPIIPWLYNKWYKLDLILAKKYNKIFCSGGVLICRKIVD